MQKPISLLYQMLQTRRPSGSKSEKNWIARYIDSIPGIQRDSYGNRIIRIGQSATMISCHTDSVHSDGGQQAIDFDRGIIRLRDKSKRILSPRYGARFQAHKGYSRNCLGADDAVGCYAALRTIAAGTPALYVFHRDEEIGGKGSAWIEQNNVHLLDGIERCIAIDRRGQEDIITHQMMGRCCSDEFALSLADSIGMVHKPCAFGSFTDSANYTDLIGECTNISAGYHYEHTSAEFVETDYVEELIDRLCSLDFESLPSARQAGEIDLYERYTYTVLAKQTGARVYLDNFLDEPESSTEDDDGDCCICSEFSEYYFRSGGEWYCEDCYSYLTAQDNACIGATVLRTNQ